jgi:hypothetical protein
MVAGLALMGFAELFIDPVAMAQITPEYAGVTGVLTGIYMLATGAVANWLAGIVAQQTQSKSAKRRSPRISISSPRWGVDAGLRNGDCHPAFAAACSVGKPRRPVNFPEGVPWLPANGALRRSSSPGRSRRIASAERRSSMAGVQTAPCIVYCQEEDILDGKPSMKKLSLAITE